MHEEISGIKKEHQLQKQLVNSQDIKLAEIAKHLLHVLREIRDLNSQSHPDVDTGDQLGRLVIELEGLSLQNLDIRQKRQIVSSLKYPERPIRHDNIPEAHQETFEWALKYPLAQEAEASHIKAGQGDILQWIRTGSGAFWVSGKPGSGKSTFMKFLADHREVQLALSSWAAPRPIIVAVHYFWNSGTMMQKSEQGLLQSILHDILWQAPDMTPDVCKKQWNDGSRTNGLDLGTSAKASWSVSELRECLRQVVRQRRPEIRLCIFIDGLDESEADHLDMAMFLAELCLSPMIKLCVSSRPWNVFEQSFGKSALSKIYMHELTRSDILKYTRSRLGEHPNWSDTVRPDEGQILVETITLRAQGVFLWVFLVNRLLREGLTNGDTFEELRVMLESFPPELEPFYKQMLDSVPSVYHPKMSGFLEIANSYHELDFMTYYYIEMEYKDVDYAVKEAVMPILESEYVRNRSRMIARFDAVCKGLLEISVSNVVVFIHRTVRDWSATEPVREYLSHKARPGFSTTLATLRATLALFKHPLPWYTLVDPTDAFPSLASEISQLNDHGSEHAKTANSIMDGFFAAAHRLAGREHFQSRKYANQSLYSPSLLFQALLIFRGFWDYLDAKLQEDDEYFLALSRKPACVFALSSHGLNALADRRETCTTDREVRVRSRVIRRLLSSVFWRSTPQFSQCSSQIKEDESARTNINSALKLIRLLTPLLGTGLNTPRIPITSCTSPEAELQAWAGLFMLPFTDSAENFAG